MKIFIVEDETEICKELSVLLQKYGYSFESSTDFEHIEYSTHPSPPIFI